MGQRTVGILYGCEAPDLPDPDGEGEAINDLLIRWEVSKKINLMAPRSRICYEYDDDAVLLGVWIAVGGSGKDGATYFLHRAVTLADVPNAFCGEITQAANLFQRFAAWCEKKEGIELPPPKLWLTPTETA